MIEVLTELKTASGEIPWTSRATALKMSTNQPRSKSQEAQEDRDGWRDSETIRFDLPEDLGRRYGKVAGDLNPIHQRAWLAKPSDFRATSFTGPGPCWALTQFCQGSPLISSKHASSARFRSHQPCILPVSTPLKAMS